MNEVPDADAEFKAIQTLYSALTPLEREAQARVVNYVTSLLQISVQPTASVKSASPHDVEQVDQNFSDDTSATNTGIDNYSTIAELYDAAQPKSNADKALIAGYWLQFCQGAENFDSQSANKELKHLGHGLANITAAIESLKNQKPALALQLKKTGKSQQARKVYKITVAGIKAVQGMIDG
ncbi:hypothetical protein [Ensifer sp. B1-9]|uniref:hypothetical protein n=1 Tax=Ensifer sp. B1-9 TaxID=3141455 RepID=UPI003D237CCC